MTKNTIRDKAQIIGKKAKVFIDSGEMVLSDKIGTPDEMEEIKVADPKNRLFACEFKPDQANGWWLLVDQRVDIIYIPLERQAAARTDGTAPTDAKTEKLKDESIFPSASIIADDSDIPIKYKKIENVRVAAILDDKFQPLDNKKRDTTPKYISFEVTPTQDAILAYAKGNGRLELSVIPSGN